LRIQIEPKEDMKQRMQKSPDIADSAMIIIDLCRTRLGAIPGGEKGIRRIEARTAEGAISPQIVINQKIQRFARIHAPRLRYGQDLASGRFR
jgi:hypothetical protein